MIIGPADRGDLSAIVAIERECFSDPWSRDGFRAMLDRPEVFFATLRDAAAGPVVGYVVAIFAGGEGEIANLAIAPASRRNGRGGRLVVAALQEAERRGAEALYLEVRESNAGARQLYDSHRFEVVGRRRRYYQRPVEDALVLRRPVGPRLT
jgi:[ribosomal protein S18]-alanine N-acetyltransferase